MAISDVIKGLFTKDSPQQRNNQAKFLNDIPVFSQFGDSIYASDIVQACIDRIASECSKLQPRHIRYDADEVQTQPKSSINRLFRISPNPLMTTRDFLEKLIWLLFLNYNAFVYPVYETYTDSQGTARKNFKAFYPLNPSQVVFEQDQTGRLFVHFYFRQGEDFTLPYDRVVHLRKKFSVNDVMGGGFNGQPDNGSLLEVLETNHILTQGLGKAIKTSLAVRGILKINTVLNDTDMDKERKRFELALQKGDSGILPTDLKGEYVPIASDPKLIDKDTLEFLEKKIIRWYGVSIPILNGDFTDEQYQAFFETVLEPIMISLGQAFTKCLFSEREQDMMNSIVFYPKNMMYLSTRSKLDIIKTAGEQGLLTNDQKLQILGYPPIGGEVGAMRTQSLNYVDTQIASDYQMARAKTKGVTVDAGGEGNGPTE